MTGAGFGYRLVDVLTEVGKPVLTRKGTIRKRVEIDPEAADRIKRGAAMIVRDNRRPGANGVVELSPFEFLDWLADLVPPPRKHRHRLPT